MTTTQAGLATFINKNFTKRDYECTNIVACRAERAPNENWVPCEESELAGLQQLWIETANGLRVTYYGHL
jgi:hypothetical protein